MSSDEIRSIIEQGNTLFGFEYNKKECHVDPYYSPIEGHSYLLFCDGEEKIVYSLDKVMEDEFFDGKCLNDIAQEINMADW